MAIADYTTYAAKLDGKQRQRVMIAKQAPTDNTRALWPTGNASSSACFAEQLYSSWTWANGAGTVPSTAVAPTRATAGAAGQQDSSGTQRLVAFTATTSLAPMNLQGDRMRAFGGNGNLTPANVNYSGLSPSESAVEIFAQWMGAPQSMLILVDRLSHQSPGTGFNGTTNTTNFPTAALTRYTSGVGVEAALEIYSTAAGSTMPYVHTFSTTPSVFTLSYTNTAGTTGKSATTLLGQSVGGTAYDELWSPYRTIPLALASGDTGVKAAASLSASNTPTISGVQVALALYYPIAVIPILPSALSGGVGGNGEALFSGGCWFPVIQSGACLMSYVRPNILGPTALDGTPTPYFDYPQNFLVDLTLAED